MTTQLNGCDGRCSYSRSVADRSDRAYPSSAVAVWLCNKILVDDVIRIAELCGKVTFNFAGNLRRCMDRHEYGSTTEISIFSWTVAESAVILRPIIYGWLSPAGYLVSGVRSMGVVWVTNLTEPQWTSGLVGHNQWSFTNMIRCHDGEMQHTRPVIDASIPDARC